MAVSWSLTACHSRMDDEAAQDLLGSVCLHVQTKQFSGGVMPSQHASSKIVGIVGFYEGLSGSGPSLSRETKLITFRSLTCLKQMTRLLRVWRVGSWKLTGIPRTACSGVYHFTLEISFLAMQACTKHSRKSLNSKKSAVLASRKAAKNAKRIRTKLAGPIQIQKQVPSLGRYARNPGAQFEDHSENSHEHSRCFWPIITSHEVSLPGFTHPGRSFSRSICKMGSACSSPFHDHVWSSPPPSPSSLTGDFKN